MNVLVWYGKSCIGSHVCTLDPLLLALFWKVLESSRHGFYREDKGLERWALKDPAWSNSQSDVPYTCCHRQELVNHNALLATRNCSLWTLGLRGGGKSLLSCFFLDSAPAMRKTNSIGFFNYNWPHPGKGKPGSPVSVLTESQKNF